MSKFLKAEKDVTEILKKKILTRTSDQLLFVEYWQRKANTVPFELFFVFPSLFGGASFKTIERVRRKIQSDHPDLKDKATAEKRFEAMQEYEQYSLNM